MFQWVRPLHLDDNNKNPSSQIATHVHDLGVDVEKMLIEEVQSESFSTNTIDSFEQEMQQPTNPPHVSIDFMSVGQSSGVGASSSSYDGSRRAGGDGDNDGGNVGQQDQSQRPLSLFINEVDFTDRKSVV